MRRWEPKIPEGVYVPGEGSQKSTIAFVGEGPGKWEALKARPFVGPSGQLLWQFSLKYLGLRRDEVYTTNLVKIRLTDTKGKDRPPTDAERKEWAKSLRRELRALPLKYIIAYGRHSAQALLRRPINMEANHGLPFSIGADYSKGPGFGPIVIPIFHPAAGLHQEKMLPYTAHGMELAREIIRGKGPQAFINPPMPKLYREGLPDVLPTLPGGSTVALDTEGPKHHPWSVQVSWETREAWLVRATDRKRLARLRDWLQAMRPTIVMHYALHDMKPLKEMGIDLLPAMDEGRVRDTLIYAANRTAEPGELKALAERHMRIPVERYEQIVAPIREKKLQGWLFDLILDETMIWPPPIGRAHSIPKRLLGIMKKSKAAKPKTTWQRWKDKKFKPIREAIAKVAGEFPEVTYDELGERFKNYACADPDYTRTVYFLLKMRSKDMAAAIDADHATLPLLERMERAGMRFDKRRAAAHMAHLRELKEDTQAAAEMLTDGEVKNPSSSHEVQRWCVNTAHLPLTRLTKSKAKESTDDNALKSVRNLHPAINYFIEYRAAVKQIGIMEPLPGLVDDDGRLRYRFNYGKVRTGRRSMGGGDDEEANLLAFPKRGPLGKGARKCFVAEPGMMLGSCDASQIELRVAAGLSQDPVMMENYRKGEDLHALTAVRLSGCSWQDAKENDDIRIPFKTANFTLLYGASPERLHETYVAEGVVRYSVEDCAAIIRDWFRLYAGIKAYFKVCIAEARRTGYITTPFGRKRMLPCIDLKGDGYPMAKLREGDERKACNTPIQGGAFELIKRAEARVARTLAKEGEWFTPVLEIHDDLMFEFPVKKEGSVRAHVQAAMTADTPFRGVPIETDWKSGPSWGELSKSIPKNKSR